MVETRVIRLRMIESPTACDQIAFFTFQSFLVEVHVMQRMRINNLEIRIAAPLVARNK